MTTGSTTPKPPQHADDSDEVIDLKDCQLSIFGYYVLPEGMFKEGAAYIDSARPGVRIHSIGELAAPRDCMFKDGPKWYPAGTHLAAPDGRFYSNDLVKCVWLS